MLRSGETLGATSSEYDLLLIVSHYLCYAMLSTTSKPQTAGAC